MEHSERNLRIADEIDALKVGHTVEIDDHYITRHGQSLYDVDGEILTFIEAYYKVVS